jgi:hypothetical protein
VRTAIRGGWLVNEETGRGRPAKIHLGEPIPERAGLPTPTELEALVLQNRVGKEQTDSSSQTHEAECSSVPSDTDADNEWWDEHGCMTDKHLEAIVRESAS